VKTAAVLAILLAIPLVAVADCQTTIAASDTIGDVKAKLNCLAKENADLKVALQKKNTELVKALEATQNPSKQYLYLANKSFLNAATCISWVADLLGKNDFGNINVVHTAHSVFATAGPDGVGIVCGADQQVIMVSGQNEKNAVWLRDWMSEHITNAK
jgi:hypothetical protein